MTLALALAVLVGIAALALLASGLLAEKEVWDLDEGAGILARLGKKRDRLLRAIKDLEGEVEAGTLSREEFATLRNDFKRRAIAASRELERVRRSRLRAIERHGGRSGPSRRHVVERMIQERKEAR